METNINARLTNIKNISEEYKEKDMNAEIDTQELRVIDNNSNVENWEGLINKVDELGRFMDSIKIRNNINSSICEIGSFSRSTGGTYSRRKFCKK